MGKQGVGTENDKVVLVVEFSHATGLKIESGVGDGAAFENAHEVGMPEDDASAHEIAGIEAREDAGQEAAFLLPGRTVGVEQSDCWEVVVVPAGEPESASGASLKDEFVAGD